MHHVTAILLIVALLTIGCTRSAELQVLDDKTGRPISGVKVTHRGEQGDMLFGMKRQTIEVPNTDDNGKVVVNGLKRDMGHTFGLEHEQYKSAAVSLPKGSDTATISSPSGPSTAKADASSTIVVRLIHR